MLLKIKKDCDKSSTCESVMRSFVAIDNDIGFTKSPTEAFIMNREGNVLQSRMIIKSDDFASKANEILRNMKIKQINERSKVNKFEVFNFRLLEDVGVACVAQASLEIIEGILNEKLILENGDLDLIYGGGSGDSTAASSGHTTDTDDKDETKMIKKQTVEIGQEIISATSSGIMSVNNDITPLVDEARVALEQGCGLPVHEELTAKRRRQLRKKDDFLLDTENYRIFLPMIVMWLKILKHAKKRLVQRTWRSFTALLILVILFSFMLHERQCVIQMFGYTLLFMFVGYFVQIFSVFGCVARKRDDIAICKYIGVV